MILSERVEDFFTNKETETLSTIRSSQDKYNNLADPVINPYNNDKSFLLDFSIKSDDYEKQNAVLTGILVPTRSQFVIKRLTIDNADTDKVAVVKKLLDSIIVNMETDHPEIGTIYWRINKKYPECLKACLDKGFDIQDSNQFSFEVTYNLMGNPIRQSNNTTQVNGVIGQANYEYLEDI